VREFTTCDASEDGACYFSADIAALTAERDKWKAAVSGLVETKSSLIDERQPDANYRQMCVKLTVERDALREEAQALAAGWRRKAKELRNYDVGMHEVVNCANELDAVLAKAKP
jgi:hypothetical protein